MPQVATRHGFQILRPQRDIVLFAFAFSAVGARHAVPEDASSTTALCVYPCDRECPCTAGLRPAFSNFVLKLFLKLRWQMQSQRRRPEAGGTNRSCVNTPANGTMEPSSRAARHAVPLLKTCCWPTTMAMPSSGTGTPACAQLLSRNLAILAQPRYRTHERKRASLPTAGRLKPVH